MRRAGAAALGLAVLLSAGAARAQFIPGSVVDQPPPPAPRFETIPPSPGAEFAWVPGRWVWDGAVWHWYHGRYRSRLLSRGTYVPGHWQLQDGAGYGWTPGGVR